MLSKRQQTRDVCNGAREMIPSVARQEDVFPTKIFLLDLYLNLAFGVTRPREKSEDFFCEEKELKTTIYLENPCM